MHRRRYIGLAGTALSVSIAGCGGNETGDDGDDGGDDGAETGDGGDGSGDSGPEDGPDGQGDGDSTAGPEVTLEAYIEAVYDTDMGRMENFVHRDAELTDLFHEKDDVEEVQTYLDTLEDVEYEIAAIEPVRESDDQAVLTVLSEDGLETTYELRTEDEEWKLWELVDGPQVSFAYEYQHPGTVEIRHDGGEPFMAGRVSVTGQQVATPGTWDEFSDQHDPEAEVRAGDAIEVPVEGLAYELRLDWTFEVDVVTDQIGGHVGPGDFLERANDYDGEFEDSTGEDEIQIQFPESPDAAFDPVAVEIDAGTAVTWAWDTGNHQVAHYNGDAFDSGVMDAGAEFSHTFEEPGVYVYECTPHSAMGHRGVVAVE